MAENKPELYLLSIDSEETPSPYNPFKLEHMVKNSLRDDKRAFTKKMSQRFDEITEENNNRQSLKKLLRKLQEIPSPDTKHHFQQKKTKLLSTMEPLLQIKQCIRVQSATKMIQKQTFNVYNEQEKVRKLIKRKLTQKRQSKRSKKPEQMKNHPTLHLLKRNSTFARKNCTSAKKLLNLLF